MQVFSVEQAKTFLKFALPTVYGTLFSIANHWDAFQRIHRAQVAGPGLGAWNRQRKENLAKRAYGSVGIWCDEACRKSANHKTAELGSRETEAIKGILSGRTSC
jgi:hypothetical protein